MKFNEYFLEILKRNSYSKNQLSKTFGINRGALHKYFNGTLILPKELLCKILEDMVIAPNERTLLWDLYYTELYGYETLNKIKALEQIILNIDTSLMLDKTFTDVPYTVDFTDFVKSNKFYLQKKSDVLSAVRYLFNSNDGGKIYTNFPYSLERLDNTVYNCCLQYPKFELIHLLYFNKISDYFKNLQNIFCSVRYLKNQINPFCRYIYGDIIKASPYPFFFAVNDCCLFFSADCTQGFLYNDAEMFLYVKETFESQKKYNYAQLAEIPKDIIETKNIVASNIQEDSEITICHYPCLAPIADADFINSLLKKEVPEIHKLATIAIDHYSQIFNGEVEKYILDESGFREFAESGKVFEVPVFINPANPSYRIRYFKKLKQFNEVGRLKIIDNTTFKLPKSIGLSAFDQWVELYGAFDNIPDEYRYSANWIIKVQDKQIVEDIKLFIDYLEQTKNFYTQKGATGLLNSMIECCK